MSSMINCLVGIIALTLHSRKCRVENFKNTKAGIGNKKPTNSEAEYFNLVGKYPRGRSFLKNDDRVVFQMPH